MLLKKDNVCGSHRQALFPPRGSAHAVKVIWRCVMVMHSAGLATGAAAAALVTAFAAGVGHHDAEDKHQNHHQSNTSSLQRQNKLIYFFIKQEYGQVQGHRAWGPAAESNH